MPAEEQKIYRGCGLSVEDQLIPVMEGFRTAKRVGIVIPKEILLRADEVVEASRTSTRLNI